jgi:SulP family sulfate permease
MGEQSSSMIQDLHPRRLLPVLTAGLVVGLLEIALATSFAALIFAGELSSYVPQGIGLALMGTILASILLALFSSLPGTVGGSQDVPAALMAVVVAAIVAVMPAGASSQEKFLTAVAAITLTTLLAALFFFGLGVFKLGALVRFLPYPVIGGFLAGTGWLLVTGAFHTMVDVPQETTLFSLIMQPEKLIYWLPGLILAVVMLLLLHRSDHFLLMPGLVLGGTLLFYLLAWLSGTSLAELGAQGFLLGPFPTESLWQPLTPVALAQVNYSVIVSQAASLATIFLVSSVALLLNVSGLELATKQDLKLNRELSAAGLANLASGIVSGLINFQQLSLSALNFKSKANSRLVGLIAAGLCAAVLLFGAAVFSLVPIVVISALLLYLGLSFLYEWLVEGWFRMPKIDYLIVVLILLVTATIGFLEAVTLGFLVAVLLFVVGYSRIDVVRQEWTEITYHSRVTRSHQQRQILQQEEEQVLILELQGFIFFGTADNLLKRIRWRIEDPERPQPRFVLLDFRRVTGLDSTATLSFTRMQHLAESKTFILIYAGTSAQVRRQLAHGVAGGEQDMVQFFSSLEQGIESCENQILQQAGLDAMDHSPSLSAQLAEILPDAEDLSELLPYFEEIKVDAGYCLIRQGDTPQDLFFVQDGQVTAMIGLEKGEPVRLETMGSGVVGEIGFYLGNERTASVVADVPTTLYRLSRDSLQQMEKETPQAATTLHRLLAHLLSERVTHLVKTVGALER